MDSGCSHQFLENILNIRKQENCPLVLKNGTGYSQIIGLEAEAFTKRMKKKKSQ